MDVPRNLMSPILIVKDSVRQTYSKGCCRESSTDLNPFNELAVYGSKEKTCYLYCVSTTLLSYSITPISRILP